MSYEIAVINPRGTPRRNKKGRFVKGGKRTRSKRRTHKRRKTAARASNPRTRTYHRRRTAKRRASNPRSPVRRRKSHARTARTYHRRRRYSNPRFSIKGIVAQLAPAGVGAIGALALDVGLGYAPVPAMLKTGIPNILTKVAGALLLGFAAGKVFGGNNGKLVTAGGLTVVAYSALKDVVRQYAPSLPGLVGEYEEVTLGYMNPASVIQPGAGAYLENGGAPVMMAPTMGAPGAGAYMDNGF
jgi:hypothetical protein